MGFVFCIPFCILRKLLAIGTGSNGLLDTCAGIQVAGIPGIVSTYAVDSYKPVASSLFVAITVNKNVWGYGFSKFITVCEDPYYFAVKD